MRPRRLPPIKTAMRVDFGFGNGVQTVDLPDENVLGVLLPNQVSVERCGADAVIYALANPIGAKKLCETVRAGEKIAVVTSDITRPMPTAKVMPFLLDELYKAGVQSKDITLVFALGSHRNHTPEEMRKRAGERAFAEIQCVDSAPDDCVRMGFTQNGTPVDITRVVAEADRRICLGNIEYHYFAGYSGGAKALMPGVRVFRPLLFKGNPATGGHCVGVAGGRAEGFESLPDTKGA